MLLLPVKKIESEAHSDAGVLTPISVWGPRARVFIPGLRAIVFPC